MTLRNPVRLLVVLALLLGSIAGITGAGAAADDPVPLDRHGRAYYVVQLDGPIEKAEIDALRLAGAGLVSYLPDFAYKARMTPDDAAAVAGLPGVVSVTPFPAAGKLAADLAATGIYRVRVERGADAAAVAAAIAAAGVEVLSADGRIVMVSGDLAAMRDIAGIADVAWVENLVMREPHNEYGAGAIVGGNAANQAGYDGSTQIVAVADTGLGGGTASTAHPDIPASRIAAIYDWPGTSVTNCYRVTTNGSQDPSSGHGTHVAVSVLGDGDAAGRGRGTAPAARLVFQSVEDHLQFRGACGVNPNGYYLIGIPDDLTPLLQQAYNAGARIHSDSWGSNVAGSYTSDSRTVDQFTWNNKSFLMTTSAGNEGTDANRDGVVDPDSTGAPGTAKNVLTVGASENNRQGNWQCQTGLGNGCTGQNNIFTYGASWPGDYPVNPLFSDPSAGNAQQMAAFSSRGPVNDGRIKPDVVAPGTWILSGYSPLYRQGFGGGVNPLTGTYQNDGWGTPLSGDYKYMGGTSMANPIAAGGAAVVRDYYEKAHGHSASAALTKATLINSAVDLLDENNDGANDNDFPIPNNHEGWGRIDVAAATRGTAQFFDSPSGLLTGGSSSQVFTVEPGATLKVTLAWSDYPSTEAASKNLVNDLDLTVTGPGGVVYRGNVFSGGWSTTGGAADRTNNVENVYVQSAAGGTWTVTVSGFNVPFGPQPFALVVDGAGTGGGNQPPTADFSYSCTGLSCSFTDASSDADGTVVSRSWSFGDGTTSTATNPAKAYTAGGSYQVRLTVTDDDGATDFEEKTVVVTAPNQPPTANFSYSCTGLFCSFTDASSDADGTVVSRSWSFGDGTTSTATNPAKTYTAGGNYLVRLTVTDDDGAIDVEEKTVSVSASNQPPTANFTFTCTGLSCSFTDASSDADGTVVSRSWSFGDGTTSTATNPAKAYTAGGSYQVRLTVTDDDGATDFEEKTVVVTAPNQPPTADFTFTCSGLSCSFTDASSDSDGTIVSRSWTFGDGTTSTATNPAKTYTAGGNYLVRLTVTDDDGATDFEERTVVVTGPGGGTTMHIADLDGSAFSEQRTWRAVVTVFVVSNTGTPVQGATVSGSWRRGGPGSCVTTATGRCDITLSGIKVSAEQFVVSVITHATLSYSPSANTDPDGDSDGTSITIQEP